MNSNDPTETADRTTESESTQPTYAHLDPRCPVCGDTTFASTEEGIPNGYECHHVHVTCATCKIALTIEYRAIDVSWFDAHSGHHSAVSQDLLEPTQTKYVAAEMYAPLPEQSVLDQLDWPHHCENCTEPLTGNDMLTDPGKPERTDSDATEPADVLFECPNCGHHSSGTTAEST
jgi:transcription elongation factor Elf1